MNIFDLWLASAEISNKNKIEMVKEFCTAENLWYYVVNKRNFLYDINITGKLIRSWDEEKLKDIIKQCTIKGIKSVTYQDELYPASIKNIEDPPYVIFYYGDLERLGESHSVAVVGSRHCTHYGIDATRVIVEDLCLNNINIISGLARGIDSVAHNTSIMLKNYTCAVLGCGIDVIYPRENKLLYSQISEAGAIISEFLPGTQPYANNFPRRNRIISALSDIVIVIEAGFRSGSLITARTALEQGKDVMALPGSVFSEASKGTNKLIKDGAFPLTSALDIYDLLGMNTVVKKEKNPLELSPEEKTVIGAIGSTPIHIDDIIRICDIDIKRLYELLFEMQLKNEIMCISGNYYAKINKEI